MITPQPKKAIEYWDHQAASFDGIYSGQKSPWGRFLDHWLRKDIYQRLEWVLREAGDLRGKSVCDLGCGTGRYAMAFAQAGAQRILGVDSAPTMIDLARSIVEKGGVADRCEFQVHDILQCPTHERFDITVSVGLFDYVADPVPFLSRMRQITGERLLTTFPRKWSWRMPIRKVRLGLLGCPVYFFTESEIVEAHRRAGLVCQKIEVVGAIYCVHAVPAAL